MTYAEIKQEERRKAQTFIDEMNASTDPALRYKTSHPITDLKDMMYQSLERYGADQIAFKQRFVKGEPFKEITYGQTLSDMNSMGTALLSLGLKDKKVAVIGENCYQWANTYLAVVNGVGVIVPLDKELGKPEIEGLIREADVEAVVYTKKYQDRFEEIKKDGNTNLRFLINMNIDEHQNAGSEDETLSWKQLIMEGRTMLDGGDRSYVDAEIDSEKMSILLFTSGTTGIAKGVMHNHRTLCYDIMAAPVILETLETDVFFSVLPIHHTYECTCTFLMGMYKGSCVAFCEGLKYIQKNLQEIKPTFFLGVPLIFESLYRTIWKNIKKQGKEEAVNRILKLNRMTSKLGLNITRLLLKDITSVFGGKLDIIISGGAAIDPTILQFFNDLGIKAVQGYGLTECAPMAALNSDTFTKLSSCGHIIPCSEMKIIDEEDGVGEILIKGRNVMLGYYNMPKETEKVLKDGWFHTGDIGYIDKDKYVFITGRKKNVIITKNGKNVFPEELEYLLGKCPLVLESMVWAKDNESGQDDLIIASIRPNMEEIGNIIGKDKAGNPDEVYKILKSEVDRINEGLPVFKQIRKIVVRYEEFDKTTGHKIKRFVESNKAE